LLQLSNLTKQPEAIGDRTNFISDVELHVARTHQRIEPEIRATIVDIDPNVTVLDMMSLGEQVDRNFNQDRLIARVTEPFGLLALVWPALDSMASRPIT
jgi:hypothetical protein